jgi:transcriptional regulator with XRE-family HTH domain
LNNPLIEIRKEKKITISDMAILSDMSVITIQRVENGNSKSIPAAVLNTIEGWGYDSEKVQDDYSSWRKHKIKQLQEQVNQ